MKRIFIMALASLFGIACLNAQDKEIVDLINKGGKIKSTNFIFDQRYYDRMAATIPDLEIRDLDQVAKMAEEEIAMLDKILETKNAIIGDANKESKIKKRLKKYFNEPAQALAFFSEAEILKERAARFLGMANGTKESRGKKTMPEGRLLSFSYTAGNGFAGWSTECRLSRDENGKGTLKCETKQMIRMANEEPKEAKAVEVDDSVFVKVYNMIKDGELYKESKNYQPLYDVTDGTGRNMGAVIEGTEKYKNSDKLRPVFLSTGGYMSGPDHHEALFGILNYLQALYNELKDK
ncbi:MAG: hypothetical protein J6W86_06115 [Bacteroidales bacterium]|nr:hypothetical protein [Bacteroidales bacterium]